MTTIKTSNQAMIDLCWNLTLVFASVICATLISDAANAGGVIAPTAGAGGNAIAQVFCNIVGVLTGITGKAIATVAVIAVGVGALLGKVSWGMALIVALGVALVFGAASIVTNLGGDSTACAVGTASFT